MQQTAKNYKKVGIIITCPPPVYLKDPSNTFEKLHILSLTCCEGCSIHSFVSFV